MGLFRSAYSAVYRGIVSALSALGLPVNGTADLPRVELHSFTENEPLDKEGRTRSLTVVVDSMSETSVSEAVGLAETSVAGLIGSALDLGEGFRVLGVLPTQLQDLPETSDSQKVIYRVLQTFNVFVTQI